MKTRPHHPHLARLLAPLVGSQKQAQYMLSLYLVRGSMTVEEWVDYRAHLVGILHHLLPLRHYPAVERLKMPPAASSTATPTPGHVSREIVCSEVSQGLGEERQSMTSLDLTRLSAHHALTVARRLLPFTPEGLQVVVRHPSRVLCYLFGPPWPGGRGRGARPLRVWREKLGAPGETCPLPHLPPPASGELPEGRLLVERGRSPSEGGGREERLLPWRGRL